MRFDISRQMFFLSSAALVFAYGFAVGGYDIFPSRILRAGVSSVALVWRERAVITHTRPEHHLYPARYEGEGVTRAIVDRMEPGLTLLSGFFIDTNELQLLREDGTLVHKWPVSFSEIFPDPTHIQPADLIPATDWNIYLHGAQALPDGSVVFNFDYGGTAKLDRCGTVQWAVSRMTHHSIEFSEAGHFWIPSRRWVVGPSAFPPIQAPYSEDTLLEISGNGEILQEISVPGLLFRNNLQALLLTIHGSVSPVYIWRSEIVHLNDLEPLSAGMAYQFPQFAAGDLLISLRNRNLIMVVDPSTEIVKWYRIGPWIRQHDPDFMPEGSISVFNNNTDHAAGAVFGGGNILGVVPGHDEVVVRYGSSPGETWYTEWAGKHQNLPNGNILIVETYGGRVFEVTAEGEVVWEFINRYDDDEIAEVRGAIRYPEDYFTVSDWTCGDLSSNQEGH